MLIMAGSDNDTHSWITTIAALGRVGYRAEMRSRRANAELPKWDRRLGKKWAAPAGRRKSLLRRAAADLANSLPECHQHSTAHNPRCGEAAASSSKACCTTVREFCRYRASTTSHSSQTSEHIWLLT